MELSLLILICIHKSYVVYLEIYIVPMGHGFSFFGHGKSMLKKRGHPEAPKFSLLANQHCFINGNSIHRVSVLW